MMNPIRLVPMPVIAVLATTMLSPSAATAFEDINMGVGVYVDGNGNVVVNWNQGGFDEYHVGWRVNGGPRGARTRPGDKRFTVLMPYRAGSVYEVEVQGCTKHTFGHDECTSWDTISCGAASRPCEGTAAAAAARRRRGGYTY